jgi:uncharacterized protein
MAEYLHPGVYIEETSYRSAPLEGVSTSTTGLVGRTRKGREGNATLVTSFTEFTRTFGDPFPITASTPPKLGDYLGHAVRAFFDNGGKRAYIVRTLSKLALASTETLDIGQIYTLPANTTVRGPTMTITLNTTRGLKRLDSLHVWSRSVPPAAPVSRGSVTIDSIDVTRNTITTTVATGLPTGVTLSPNNTFFKVLDPGSPGPVFTALSRGKDGDQIAVQIRPTDGPPVRLTAAKFVRSSLVVQTFSGIGTDKGPLQTDTTLNLTVAAVARLLPNDSISLSDPAEPSTISGIATTSSTVAVSGASGSMGNPITLVTRNGVSPTTPILVGSLTGAATAADIPIDQSAAVILRNGDWISIAGAPKIQLAGDPNIIGPTVTVPTRTADHLATTISVTQSAPVVGMQRLFVGDATGLAVPCDVTPQTIAITDGTTTVSANVQLVDPLTNTVWVSGAAVPTNWTSFDLLDVAGSPTGRISVATTNSFYTGAYVELFDGATNTKFQSLVTAVDPGSRTITLQTAPPVITVPADPSLRNAYAKVLEIDVLTYEGGTLAETFSGLTWNADPTVDAKKKFFVDLINDADNGSDLVSVSYAAPAPDLLSQPITSDGFPLNLQGGDDGPDLTDIDLIGEDNGPGKRTGIMALAERSDIALVAVPGVTDEAVQGALLTHCELLRYRFAILDGKPNQSDISEIESHRANYDSLYGGYYAPWLKTIDLTTGATMLAPPSGYVLGICARVDDARGVWKAPANEVVSNILDVELPFTDGEQDVLNPQGINLIRAFEGRGIRVWGARTTSSQPEWRYVNVRRLFIFLEHSIDNGTQWVVFEPNNEALWQRVVETIESFMFGVWKSGALMGTKPEEAYFVRCDRTTMTQDDIDNGRLVCLIGVAPAYPAEFVIFRIGQFTASTNQA